MACRMTIMSYRCNGVVICCWYILHKHYETLQKVTKSCFLFFCKRLILNKKPATKAFQVAFSLSSVSYGTNYDSYDMLATEMT